MEFSTWPSVCPLTFSAPLHFLFALPPTEVASVVSEVFSHLIWALCPRDMLLASARHSFLVCVPALAPLQAIEGYSSSIVLLLWQCPAGLPFVFSSTCPEGSLACSWCSQRRRGHHSGPPMYLLGSCLSLNVSQRSQKTLAMCIPCAGKGPFICPATPC